MSVRFLSIMSWHREIRQNFTSTNVGVGKIKARWHFVPWIFWVVVVVADFACFSLWNLKKPPVSCLLLGGEYRISFEFRDALFVLGSNLNFLRRSLIFLSILAFFFIEELESEDDEREDSLEDDDSDEDTRALLWKRLSWLAFFACEKKNMKN